MLQKNPTPYTQDVNWTYIRRSEDVQDVFWTSSERSIYILYLRGIALHQKVSLYSKATLSQMFDMVLNTPLYGYNFS